ncbi:uncharacterized protein LOC143132638 [Alosa pseudoharengus]|uniref:uncharacterized protein LOC143132638 n=1 Tax=Alosa pseudoharengus TaxID=34774 RepID=UPI003F8CED12
MAQLSSVSDSEGLVQSMLQRLRLQEQRSEQASTTSEDKDKILQEVEDEEETFINTVNDNLRSPRTKWPGFSPFFKGSTKALGLRKGSTGQKENLSFSVIEEEFPRWERKQLRFTLVSNQISERKNSHCDKTDALLEPPLNHENHTSPAGEAEGDPRPPVMQTQTNAEVQRTDSTNGDELSAPLAPGSVIQVHTVTDSPIWDSITTEDTASSSTDSLSRINQPVGQVVTSKTSNNGRKNKRKWAETKTKKLTQRIKDKWRDRRSSVERQDSQNGEKFGKKQHQHNVAEQVSNESSKVKENAVLPLPIRRAEDEVTPCPQGYDSISLCAFDLGFSTNLMEEIFTGPEWDKFFTMSNSPLEVPESANDQSTYPAVVDLCKITESRNAISVPESTLNEATEEAMLTDTDELVLNAGQPMCMESSEHSINQLTILEQVRHIQPGTVEVNSDQGITTEPQMTTNSLDQSNLDAVNYDQSESRPESNKQNQSCDIKGQQTHMMGPDLNQTSPSDMHPHQTEVTMPNLDQNTTSEINPHQTQMTTPDLIETNTSNMNPNIILTTQADDQSDQVTHEPQMTEPTLNQPDSSDMMNPYLTETTQAGDQSETEEATEPTINSSPSEGDDNAPQLLPLLDFSYVEAGDGKDSSAHEKKRRALQSEERETFIDEDDDDGDVPTKSVSHRKAPLSPPPFAPPPPPSQLATQRSISLDSDSSLSMEVVPKKRKLDYSPRRVRFAEEVVMLPSYIQPEVEDWPEPEGMEEDSDEMDDPEDMEDTEEMVLPEEISTTKETSEKSPEAQSSLYNWIVGMKRKTKRKAQI